MEKEELLAKSRNENKKCDEFEKKIITKATSIAWTVMAIAIGVVFFYDMFKNRHYNYGVWGALMISLGIYYTILGSYTKKKTYLVSGIIIDVCALAAIVMYIITDIF